ncbi:Hypothetical predicted protein [Octopus vulgaris]|uniref:Uncharacterized protein n=1 Tax=Octopus vulgaris TaxID=6645 RepID=A0AA36BQ70_OCTVU|nr:Hypothetical predicted protein [Octopus vulgaris]
MFVLCIRQQVRDTRLLDLPAFSVAVLVVVLQQCSVLEESRFYKDNLSRSVKEKKKKIKEKLKRNLK